MENDANKNEEVKNTECCPSGGKFRCRKWKKAAGIALAVIVVLVVALVIFLDSLVVKTVRTVGPEITGTPVELKNVSIGLFTGRVSLEGLTLGNPAGYQHPNAFELEKLVLHVDLGTVLSNKIRVKEITVKGMSVDMEIKPDGSTNLADIKNHVDSKLNAASKEESAEKEPEAKTEKKEAQKVVIGLIDVSDVKVRFGSAVAVPIPGIRMENVGERTPMEVVNEFFTKLLRNISVEAANKGLKNMGDAAGKMLDKGNAGLQKAGEKVSKELEKAGEKVSKELEKAGEKVSKELEKAGEKLKKIKLF